jgi:hypothetical protein
MQETQNFMIPSEATPEGAALVLLQLIARAEGKTFDKNLVGDVVDRKWILNAYYQAIRVVKGNIPPATSE